MKGLRGCGRGGREEDRGQGGASQDTQTDLPPRAELSQLPGAWVALVVVVWGGWNSFHDYILGPNQPSVSLVSKFDLGYFQVVWQKGSVLLHRDVARMARNEGAAHTRTGGW